MNISRAIFSKKFIVSAACALAAVIIAGAWFEQLLSPVAFAQRGAAAPADVLVEIRQGEGFRTVASDLRARQLIRSAWAFDAYAVLDGAAFSIKPGLYRLNPSMASEAILAAIAKGGAGEALVTIPEGSNIYEIDGILSKALVIHPGDLIRYQASGAGGNGNLEGRLFPDTYQFYTDADVRDVEKEMLDNFAAKAAPLLGSDKAAAARTLVIASILEKEVPGDADRRIVAGILLKRFAAGMPLDIDATVCYANLIAANAAEAAATGTAAGAAAGSPFIESCGGLPSLDFKIKSPYNTYLYKGFPPGCIGNPGVSAITAALSPQSSPYWYYLSDPRTGKTIFAKTLDEQTQNRVKYLE